MQSAWLTSGLITSCKRKHAIYAQLLKSRCKPSNIKKYRNLLTRQPRLAKQNYYTNFIASHKKDPRAMWTFINTHQCSHSFNILFSFNFSFSFIIIF
jgi:hypothetical protein